LLQYLGPYIHNVGREMIDGVEESHPPSTSEDHAPFLAKCSFA